MSTGLRPEIYEMYDPELSAIISEAVGRLHTAIEAALPGVAGNVWQWIHSLSSTLAPEDYFRHPLAFPTILLPWWLEQQLSGGHDRELQSDLVYSTINGYYFIRLIDNVMDHRETVEVQLLPALGFFHSEFQTAYHKYFDYSHPFWIQFRSAWFQNAAVVSKDAALPQIRRDDFIETSARKICASRIPLSAICFKYEQPDLVRPWADLTDRMGCWHQMLNDVLGWPADQKHGTRTYFLHEAESRKKPAESVVAWVIREGFDWGIETIGQWLAESKVMAAGLNNPQLDNYLANREAILAERRAEIEDSMLPMKRLLALSG